MSDGAAENASEDATVVIEPPRPRINFSDFFGVDPEIVEQ
jgi:hypothetical protein